MVTSDDSNGDGDGAGRRLGCTRWDGLALEYLQSYVPRQLLGIRRLECKAEQFDGAVLFLDIAGFSKLSTALLSQAAEQGLARRGRLPLPASTPAGVGWTATGHRSSPRCSGSSRAAASSSQGGQFGSRCSART